MQWLFRWTKCWNIIVWSRNDILLQRQWAHEHVQNRSLRNTNSARIIPTMVMSSTTMHNGTSYSWIIFINRFNSLAIDQTNGLTYFPNETQIFPSGNGPRCVECNACGDLRTRTPPLRVALRVRSVRNANGPHPIYGTAQKCAIQLTEIHFDLDSIQFTRVVDSRITRFFERIRCTHKNARAQI